MAVRRGVVAVLIAVQLAGMVAGVAARADEAPATEADQTPEPPGAADLRRINRALARARVVHVTTTAHAFDVRKPRASDAGLAFERAVDFPPPRPALFATGWDTIPPPANPLPWSSIESIERVHSGQGPGAIGGAIGAAAIVIPIGTLFFWGYGSDALPAVLLYGGGVIGLGAMLGSLFGGMAESHEIIYEAADAASARSVPGPAPGLVRATDPFASFDSTSTAP